MPPRPFQYALRRTLPPWSLKWRLKMLESVIDSWRLDEIVLNIDAEEFNHAQLNTEWLDHYLPMLAEAKRRLEAKGARVSLNPWCTVSHYDNGRDGAEVIPGFRGMVDIGGKAAQACSCMLSRNWRAHVRRLWERYARLTPCAIWLETDLRHFGHPPNIKYGCFCEAHRRLFSERAGLDHVVSREELRAALLQPGEPHPWRRLWLEMQGEETNAVAAMLARTIRAVSPETQLGLMPSGPRTHTLEGRDWTGLRHALNENDTLPYLSRPDMGGYTEITPLHLYKTVDSIILTRKLMPNTERELASLENFPYSRINRNINSTRAELLLAATAGSDGVVLGLFDAFGNPMEAAARIGAMLQEMKPRLVAISQMRRSPGRDRGINIAFSPDYGKTCHAAGGNILQLTSDGESAATLLGLLGVPWVYDDEAPITLLTGETARALPDALILKWLSGGLWLDAPAAVILQERGFGDLVGVSHFDRPVPPSALHNAAGEEFLPATIPPRYDSLFIPNFGNQSTITLLTPADGAQPFSRAVDNDGRPLGCTGTLFRNRLGGRVFVHAFIYDPYASSVTFCTSPRLEALGQMLTFLDGGTGAIPLRLTGDGVCAYPLRRDLEDGRVLLGFMNFSNDTWDEFTFHLPDGEEFDSAETLEGISRLPYPQPLDLRDGRWTLQRTVAPKETFFALLHRRGAECVVEEEEIPVVGGDFAEADFPLALHAMEKTDAADAARLADFRRHCHDLHELLIVHGGRARLECDGEEAEIGEGDMLLLRPRTVHALADPDGLSLTEVRFAPERLPLLGDLMTTLPDETRHVRLPQPEGQRAREQLRCIKEALGTPRADRKLAALAALARLLEMMRPAAEDGNDSGEETQLLARLDKALHLIEEQYGRHLTVQELADSANASVRNFQRLFAQAFGASPMEHLQDVRLYHAEQMLTQGRLTIAEIAAECGFPSPSRFASLFKRKFGVTPQQYRRGAR